ncbi:MAG: hypothetical protein WC523_06100 [Patescibacteria group bacterium]|jgi:hypothetical protein
MFRLLNGFLALLVLLIVLKWLLPPEVSSLATEVLIKVLTLIKVLLAQVNLPS